MHTTKHLKSSDFKFELEDCHVCFEDVVLHFNQFDRVGIVVGTDSGAMGASAFILASITRFYDFFRPQIEYPKSHWRMYPEIFVFHVGKKQMDHYWMDIWPPHKEVIVEDDPEQILEAINDRGITRLLVEDIWPCQEAVFLPETVSAAKSRIVSAYAYSNKGRVENSDIRVTSCPVAEHYVIRSLKESDFLSESRKEELLQMRKDITEDGVIIETYRRISVQEALTMLTRSIEVSSLTKIYLERS